MCGDGARKGIPHVGGAFHFGFAQSQHIGLHFPKDPHVTNYSFYGMCPGGAIGFYGDGESIGLTQHI